MSNNNNSEFGAFFSGFVIGGLVGAAVALVLAPQSGQETRQQIRDKGVELKEQGANSWYSAKEKAQHAAEDGKIRAAEIASAKSISRIKVTISLI